MDDIFVTQPFTARHVRYTKKLGFGSLGTSSHLETHVFHKMLKMQLRFNQRYFQDPNDANYIINLELCLKNKYQILKKNRFSLIKLCQIHNS